MVEETIQTIKQAEKEAGEIAAQADARCEQILSQASGEAEKMKEKILQDAKTEAAAVMDSAGSIFAKAVPYFDSTELEKLQGHKSSEIGNIIGEGRKDVIFRPEDLVFTESE